MVWAYGTLLELSSPDTGIFTGQLANIRQPGLEVDTLLQRNKNELRASLPEQLFITPFHVQEDWWLRWELSG